MSQTLASRRRKAERIEEARKRELRNSRPIPTMVEHLHDLAMSAASDRYRNDEAMMREGFPLAIFECPHGSLGTDHNIRCLCWDREERVKLQRPQIIDLTQIAYLEPVGTQFELTTNDGGDAHLKGTNEFGSKLWVLKETGGYEEIPF